MNWSRIMLFCNCRCHLCWTCSTFHSWTYKGALNSLSILCQVHQVQLDFPKLWPMQAPSSLFADTLSIHHVAQYLTLQLLKSTCNTWSTLCQVHQDKQPPNSEWRRKRSCYSFDTACFSKATGFLLKILPAIDFLKTSPKTAFWIFWSGATW